MRSAELVLYSLAKLLYRSEVAQSTEMKAALISDTAYAEHRNKELAKVTQAAARYAVPIKGTILDLGCNDGAITVGYLNYGADQVIGIDIDSKAIERANQLRAANNASFYVGTIDSIPMADSSVDTIFSYDVFEHVSDVPGLLREIRRVLRPGGKALIGTWGWKNPFAPHLWSTMPVPWAHCFVSEPTLLRACRRVYRSSWYQPNMHDLREDGTLKDKYNEDHIPREYLNKYLIRDFERAFSASGMTWEIHASTFGKTPFLKPLLAIPRLREYLTAYFWAVLMRTDH